MGVGGEWKSIGKGLAMELEQEWLKSRRRVVTGKEGIGKGVAREW